jgi:signal transduction histidine kinase
LGRILRPGWYAVALSTAGIFIASIPGYIKFVPLGITYNQRFAFNPSPDVLTLNIVAGILSVAGTLLSFYLALVFFRRRPQDRMTIFLAYFLLVFAALHPGPAQMLAASLPEDAGRLLKSITVLITMPLSSYLFLLFPNGRFTPMWTRWLGLASVPLAVLLLWTFPGLATTFAQPSPRWLVTLGSAALYVYLIVLLSTQIHRYLRVYSIREKTQTKWVLYGMVLGFALWAISAIPNSWTASVPSGAPFPFWLSVSSLIAELGYFILPISLAIALTRHQLYDIDLLINRTLVYGGLSVGAVALYAVSVVITGIALHQGSQWASLLITAGFVFLSFRWLHRKIQHGVDRLLGPAPESGFLEPAPDSVESSEGKEQFDQGSGAANDLRLRLARIGWVVLMGLASLILVLAVPGFLSRRPLGDLGEHLVFDPTPLTLTLHRLNIAGIFLSVLISYGLAALLFVKRKTDGMALFLAYYMVIHGLLFGGTVEMLEPFWTDAVALNSFVLLPMISFPMTMILLAVFPDGRFIPRWTRWLIPSAIPLAISVSLHRDLLAQGLFDPTDGPLPMITTVGIGAATVAMILAQIHRYRHVSSPQQRQQSKWVLYGISVMAGVTAVATGPWSHALSLPAGSQMPWWSSLIETSWAVSTIFLPIALTISVLRYRLYDIDLLINRTVVYGLLSACVLGAYMLIVGGLGTLFQSSSSLVVSLVATGLVAVLFNPVRERLQSAVNRLLYGDRNEPLVVLRRLGQRLESSGMPEETLTAIAEIVAQALKLRYVEITLRQTGQFVHMARYGRSTTETASFPVQYQGETIAQLNVATRQPGEALADSDLGLLRQIARQAAPVAHAVRLTRDLRQSRARLVTAREEERQRLRRDLHDGLGPVLASQGLKIAAVSHLVEADPERAQQMLEELASQNEAAVTEIRRLVYALRPPELDELGLIGAVRDYVGGLNVSWDDGTHYQVAARPAGEDLPELPAAVEVAAYRIATEALTNVTRHARASHCTIHFSTGDDNRLRLEIADDGVGFPKDGKTGIGLTSMRERAEDVGGDLSIDSAPQSGTKVVASFPLAG